MTYQNYDKRKLIILRAVLLLLGAGVGALASWQYFEFFPDVVRREYRIMIIVVSSAVVAGLLWLSSKPLYRLGASIAESVGGAAAALGVRGIMGAALGFVAAGACAYVFDVIIRTHWDIWAVRLLTDTLVYILCAVLFCYSFTRWLVQNDAEHTPLPPRNGYLLKAECFNDDRVLTVAAALPNVKVCDGAFKALCLNNADSRAVERLSLLVNSDAVGVIKCGGSFSTPEEFDELENRYAESKRLRAVCVRPCGASAVELELFALPTESVKARFAGKAEKVAAVEQKVCEQGSDDDISGQIIIDK